MNYFSFEPVFNLSSSRPPVLTVKLFPVTCEYIKGEKQFYYRAQKFYEDVSASEEGMLGDFVEIGNVDLEGSRQFLQRFVVSYDASTMDQSLSQICERHTVTSEKGLLLCLHDCTLVYRFTLCGYHEYTCQSLFQSRHSSS